MKIAVVMRGVPGSGKSTFVEILKQATDDTAVHAVDDLHTTEANDFAWNESRSEARYLLNYANFIKSCSTGVSLVICDCINIESESVERYVNAARNFGYFIYVVTPDMPSVLEASARNTHQVSAVQIRDMMTRWEDWPDKTSLII